MERYIVINQKQSYRRAWLTTTPVRSSERKLDPKPLTSNMREAHARTLTERIHGTGTIRTSIIKYQRGINAFQQASNLVMIEISKQANTPNA